MEEQVQVHPVDIFNRNSPDLYQFLEHRKNEARDWIHKLSDDMLLNGDESLTKVIETFEIDPLVLDFDSAEVVDQGSVKINVRHDHRFMIWDDEFTDREPLADGHYITFAIPYKGWSKLFLFQSQNFVRGELKAAIYRSEIHVRVQDAVEFTEESLSRLQQDYFSGIKRCAIGVANQVIGFNQWLRTEATTEIEERRRVSEDRHGLVANLGFKMRKRQGHPTNVSQPIVRKKLSAFDQMKAGVKSDSLDLEIYDEILSICRNMALVMELSPSAFAELEEEHLRFHFLVQLNAVYEGQATGETFNLHGKTDIIIKHGGRNLFVGECKYWNGEAAYKEAIDQLIGRYVTWRDTRSAIIVFNRNKGFTSVLKKIKEQTIKHECCLEQLEYQHDAAYRFMFAHKDDPERTFLLTVLAFDIPAVVETT